jgi:hypothetical protein
MKVRVGNVVFEDFEANELDIVIEKLRKVGLLGSGSSAEIQAPKPVFKPVPRPIPTPAPEPKPVTAPAPRPQPPVLRPTPQTTLPQAPKPPAPREEAEEESSSSGWL